jgi:carbon starvation protein CstA
VCYAVVSTILRDKERRGWVWLPYIGTLFAVATVNIACCIHFNELAWIDERNYPNGPIAFLQQQQSRGPNVSSVTTAIVMMILSDLFLVLDLVFFP